MARFVYMFAGFPGFAKVCYKVCMDLQRFTTRFVKRFAWVYRGLQGVAEVCTGLHEFEEVY